MTARRAWSALPLILWLVVAACNATDTDVAAATSAPITTPAPIATVGSATTEAASVDKPYGGEAIVAIDREPPTLNIYAPGGDSPVVSIIGNGYWAGVQDIDGFTLDLVPDVVTRLPTVANGAITVNPDGTETIRYIIRDEARWADGTPISGADFEFTYQTIMDPDLPIVRTVYQDIDPSSIVVGDKTFEFTLSAPTLQAELIFGVILPKHDVQGSDFINDYNDAMWMSGGPFEFDRWEKGGFISLTRNENYWKTDAETAQQLPYLDSVIIRIIPDAAARIDAFKAREVDVINPPPSVATIEDLRLLEPSGARIEIDPGFVWEQLGFQFGENRLARNPNSYNEFLEYRQAVAHALDRDRIVDEIFRGLLGPMGSYVDAFVPTISQDSWDQYDYDPARAVELLAALCDRVDTDCEASPVTAVFSTTSNSEALTALASLLAPMFEDVGIAFRVELEDSSLFFGKTLDFGLFDIAEWAWVGSSGLSNLVATHEAWDPQSPPPGGNNFYRWGTPEVTVARLEGFSQGESSVIDDFTARFVELRELMGSTVDEREIISYVHEAEELLADQVVMIPLYQRLDAGAVWVDEIGGYKHNPSWVGDTWNIEEWYRADL